MTLLELAEYQNKTHLKPIEISVEERLILAATRAFVRQCRQSMGAEGHLNEEEITDFVETVEDLDHRLFIKKRKKNNLKN